MVKRKYENEAQTKEKKSKTDPKIGNDEFTVQDEQPQNECSNAMDTIPKQNLIDLKHFRKELANKQGQTMALIQFLQVCLNPNADVDYMLEYLKSGGNSHEILRQISQDNKKNLTLATPTFHLFHLIILKVQSSLPHMIAITEEACRYFLNTFVPTIEIMISENSGPRHRKIILNLLTSIVTLNSDLGVEVLNQIPLTPKSLQHIVEKVSYKEKDNVRTAFVHFITSFLVEGHLPLTKALLEKQGLLSLVIPGLVHDEPNAVLMFLNILKKNVIDNILISKTLKLRTFNQQALHNLFKVFTWRGPPEISTELKNESHEEIMSLLSNIILTLFTSHKLGLYFIDNTLGTSDANRNQNLYKCILSLKRPWQNKHQCETVLEIIYKCPDLHRAIIHIIEQNFQPQHSPIWAKTVEFVLQLLDKLKPQDMMPKFNKLTPSQTANFIRFVTLPVPLLKIVHTNIDKDRTISLHCIKVLTKMLQTLKRYIQMLEINDSNLAMTELQNKLENFLPKHVPLPSALVSSVNNVVSGNNINEQATQDYALPKIEDTDALLSLIDLLLLYNFIHPAYFESLEGTINMRKILEFTNTLSSGKVSLLKFKIVSLWMTLDSSVLSLQNSMFKDLFLILLEVYINEVNSAGMEARKMLQIFCKNTEIFENDEDEIQLMLYTLRNSKITSMSLIVDIVEYVLKNKNELTKYVKEQVVNFEISDEDNRLDLEKMLNDLMNNKNMENSFILENRMPSPFIVGCMQFIQSNKEAKKSLKQFLSLFVTNLLHYNFSPELTEVLIGDSKLEARSYVASWLVEPVPLPDTACNDSTLVNLSKSLIGNEDIALSDIFKFLRLSESSDIIIADVKYEIDCEKFIDSSDLFIWIRYLMFCVVRLTNMEKFHESEKNKIEIYFDVIIELGKKYHLITECRHFMLALLKNAQLHKIYNPVDLNEGSCCITATKLILGIINKYYDMVTYLNRKHFVLKPYQQKNYNEIMKFIKMGKKENINSEHTTLAMDIVGLSAGNNQLVLDKIFTSETESLIKNGKEPTLVQELLCALLNKYSKLVSSDFTHDIVHKLMNLYTKLLTYSESTPDLTNLETTMISYFEKKPQQVVHVKEDDFRKFFNANTIRKTTSLLASILLKFNKRLVNVFVEQVNRPEILTQRELTLPIGNVAITHNEFLIEHKNVLDKIYAEYKNNVLKVLKKPHKAGHVYMNSWQLIKKIIIECMEMEECQKFFNQSHKFETIQLNHLHLVQTVFLKLCLSDIEFGNDCLINYFLTMIHVSTNALKEHTDDTLVSAIVSNVEEIMKISKIVESLKTDNNDFKKVTDTSIWQGFCKTVLKNSLRVRTLEQANVTGPKMLSLMSGLIRTFYANDHPDIVALFDMVTSHSEFLNVILSHQSQEIKFRLLELLHVLITTNKSVMKSQQIPVYLSAYGATRNPCDRLILTILQFYEINNLPVNEYKPYVFGDSAASFYVVRKSKISTLWGHPSPNQVINLFEKDVIERTVKHFPVNQRLEYTYVPQTQSITSLLDKLRSVKPRVKDIEWKSENLVSKENYLNVLNTIRGSDVVSLSHVENDNSVYDPAFVYPLLSHLLAPGSVASCFKLLRSGLLSVVVMGLSSHCPLMRAAAYHVLHRFCMLLETETRHKNDKLLLTDFITTLRQSLSTAIDCTSDEFKNVKNPKLPAIGALYLARALMVSTSPSEALYKPVNNFLIAKHFVDLTIVPDFLSLFHDSEVETVERRHWALEIIQDGTKTMVDIGVIFKTMCLKMIMDFYATVLSDNKTKRQILKTLSSIISIPRAFEILMEGYGFLSWLHYVVRDLNKEDRLIVKEIIVLLTNIINSVNINAFVKHCAKIDVDKVEMIGDFRLKSDVESEILTIICNVLPSIDVLEVEDLLNYVKLMNKVTKRSIKFLNKKHFTNIIVKCCHPFKDSDCAKLMELSITSKNPLMILNKDIVGDVDSVEGYLMEELRTLVYTYVS